MSYGEFFEQRGGISPGYPIDESMIPALEAGKWQPVMGIEFDRSVYDQASHIAIVGRELEWTCGVYDLPILRVYRLMGGLATGNWEEPTKHTWDYWVHSAGFTEKAQVELFKAADFLQGFNEFDWPNDTRYLRYSAADRYLGEEAAATVHRVEVAEKIAEISSLHGDKYCAPLMELLLQVGYRIPPYYLPRLYREAFRSFGVNFGAKEEEVRRLAESYSARYAPNAE